MGTSRFTDCTLIQPVAVHDGRGLAPVGRILQFNCAFNYAELLVFLAASLIPRRSNLIGQTQSSDGLLYQ